MNRSNQNLLFGVQTFLLHFKSISREWRQKIESWLQANEQDDRYNDEYRKKMRRITTNRRSLETDTGTNQLRMKHVANIVKTYF